MHHTLTPLDAVVLLIILAGAMYGAGRLHARYGYRVGYRYGCRDGFGDGHADGYKTGYTAGIAHERQRRPQPARWFDRQMARHSSDDTADHGTATQIIVTPAGNLGTNFSQY